MLEPSFTSQYCYSKNFARGKFVTSSGNFFIAPAINLVEMKKKL